MRWSGTLWLFMPSSDVVRLRHMREAAAKAMEMAAGRERADLSSNEMLAMALTRCLEILGEAASKISPEARVRFRLVPFAKMIVMRNHLIHAYFDINLDNASRPSSRGHAAAQVSGAVSSYNAQDESQPKAFPGIHRRRARRRLLGR